MLKPRWRNWLPIADVSEKFSLQPKVCKATLLPINIILNLKLKSGKKPALKKID
jgi:hypothetical protein